MTLKRDEYGNQVQAMHPYASQVVAIGAASVPGPPFTFVKEPVPPVLNTGAKIPKAQRTMHVRIIATVPCWIAFGPSVDANGAAVTAPVAARLATGSMFMPAGIPEYFWVRPKERIAAITDSGSIGSVYVTELANN